MLGVRSGLAALVVGVAILIGSPAALGATQQQSLAQTLSSGIQAAGGASAARAAKRRQSIASTRLAAGTIPRAAGPTTRSWPSR